MIYTSGIVTDLTREETLEELQDNKLTVVCEKVFIASLHLEFFQIHVPLVEPPTRGSPIGYWLWMGYSCCFRR